MSASAYIYADTMTWASKGAEVNRVAQYSETASVPCQWEPRHGAYRSVNGDLSEYSLEVLTRQTGIKEGDQLKKGDEVYTVVYVDEVYMRGRYHHSEVFAK